MRISCGYPYSTHRCVYACECMRIFQAVRNYNMNTLTHTKYQPAADFWCIYMYFINDVVPFNGNSVLSLWRTNSNSTFENCNFPSCVPVREHICLFVDFSCERFSQFVCRAFLFLSHSVQLQVQDFRILARFENTQTQYSLHCILQ